MDIKRSITINLSVDEIRQIIAEKFKQDGYEVSEDSIAFLVSKTYVGSGMGERLEAVFSGASIKTEVKKL